MNRHSLTPFLLSITAVVLIVISYYYFDQPIVWLFITMHSRHLGLLRFFANDIIGGLTILIALYYVYFFTKQGIHHHTSLDKKLILPCHSVVIGLFLKDILKHVFGRYWPSTFICNNPSLIKHHLYGFHWFHSSPILGSFPSGHTTMICAFSVCMWPLFPKLRSLWILLIILVVVGQVGMYYHFMSDVLAGILLGSLIGYSCAYSYAKTNTTKIT